MAAIGRIISAALLLLGGLACGPGFDFSGTWTGLRKLQVAPGTDPAVLRSLEKVVVTIHPNGRFELFESDLPKEGAVSYSRGRALLEVQNILGHRIEAEPQEFRDAYAKPMELAPQPDGTISFIDPNFPERPPVTLTRKSASAP
jgi:hypothetical protein